MNLLGILIFFIVGLSAIIWYKPKLHILEGLALSYIMGVGLVTTIMFWLSAIGISFGLPILLPLLIAGSLSSLVLAWRRGLLGRALRRGWVDLQGKISLHELVLLLTLIVLFFFMFTYALLVPLGYGPDAIGRSLPALAFADRGTIQVEEYPLLQIAHPQYPLLVPLAEAFLRLFRPGSEWIYAENIKILFPMYFLSLLAIFFFRLKEKVRPATLALLSVVVLGTTPFFVWLGSVYSLNLPASVYLFAGSVYLYSWWEDRQSSGDLWLAGTMLGFFAWTRFEGLLFGLAPLFLAAWLGLRLSAQQRERLGWPLPLFLPYLLTACPWGLYRRWRWAAYGRLAIISDVDLPLILVTGGLILGYTLFTRYGVRTTWADWLIHRLNPGLVILVSILIVGAVTGWYLVQDWVTTSWRLQRLYENFTRPLWGGLVYLALLLPFLSRRVVNMWYLWVLPLWILLTWILVYAAGKWPSEGTFYWTGSANRTLFYFYALFLFAVTRLLTADAGRSESD